MKKSLVLVLFLSILFQNVFALGPKSKINTIEIKEYVEVVNNFEYLDTLLSNLRQALIGSGDDDYELRTDCDEFLEENKYFFQNELANIFINIISFNKNDFLFDIKYLGSGFYKHALSVKINDYRFVLKFVKKYDTSDLVREFELFNILGAPKVYIRGENFIIEEFIDGDSFEMELFNARDSSTQKIRLKKLFLRYIIDSYCKTLKIINGKFLGIFILDFNPQNFFMRNNKLVCIDGGNSGHITLWKTLEGGAGNFTYDFLPTILTELENDYNISKQQSYLEVLNMFFNNFKNNIRYLDQFYKELSHLNFKYVSENVFYDFSDIVGLFICQDEIQLNLKYNSIIKKCA